MTTVLDQKTLEKEHALKERIGAFGAMAVAYSGGVDSTYLADVASEVLGEQAHILIADSPSIPRSELREALGLAKARGWNVATLHTREFDDDRYLANDGQRCYYCKAELFTQMREYADGCQVKIIAHGDNADDRADPTRIGAVAAREHGAVAPLLDVGLTKAEIRLLSKKRGLPTATKASFACLGSRFPTGTRLDPDSLRRVERVEEVLKRLDFHQYRARHHGDLCLIEVELEEFPRLLDPTAREAIQAAAHAAGYRHVTLDLAGYRMGSAAGS